MSEEGSRGAGAAVGCGCALSQAGTGNGAAGIDFGLTAALGAAVLFAVSFGPCAFGTLAPFVSAACFGNTGFGITGFATTGFGITESFGIAAAFGTADAGALAVNAAGRDCTNRGSAPAHPMQKLARARFIRPQASQATCDDSDMASAPWASSTSA